MEWASGGKDPSFSPSIGRVVMRWGFKDCEDLRPAEKRVPQRSRCFHPSLNKFINTKIPIRLAVRGMSNPQTTSVLWDECQIGPRFHVFHYYSLRIPRIQHGYQP